MRERVRYGNARLSAIVGECQITAILYALHGCIIWDSTLANCLKIGIFLTI